MALTAGGVIELRTTGDDSFGGGFNPASAGVDYSQQNSAQLSVTDGVTNGTTTVTSATGGFTSQMIGNYINIAGTVYEITARTDTNTITVDRTISANTGLTMKVGGAAATPGMVGKIINDGALVSGQVHQKAGTYTGSSASANVSGGTVNIASGRGGTQTAPMRWTGYNATRGDLSGTVGGTRPLWSSGAFNFNTYLVIAGDYVIVEGLTFEKGTNTGTLTAINSNGSYHRIVNCKFSGLNGNGVIIQAALGLVEWCEGVGVTSASGAFRMTAASGRCSFCVARDSTAPGFNCTATGVVFDHCIAFNLSGATTDGFVAQQGYTAINCIAYNCGRSGFFIQTNTKNATTFTNCHAENNAAEGWKTDGVSTNCRLYNCSGYNNTGGNYSTTNLPDTGLTKAVFNFKALTSSAFTDAGSADFTLNATAGGGAELRASGAPSAYPGLSGTSYGDIGAYQHQDSGGGGTTVIVIED